MKSLKFRPGDTVTVKSEREILATLDQDGTTEGLPFMPEMRRFCGRVLTVRTRINRIHISGVGVRGIKNAVILSEARCGGEAHNECGRACYVLFKEVWLKEPPSAHAEQYGPEAALSPDATPGFWKCNGSPCQGQASPLVRATTPLPGWDLRQYIDDIRRRTYSVYDVAALSLFRLNRRWGAREDIWRFHSAEKSLWNLVRMSLHILRQNIAWLIQRASRRKLETLQTPPHPLTSVPKAQGVTPALQPGDLVEVKSREEILSTLNAKDKGLGLRFYGCMWKHCGQRYRVLAPVSRLIDEMTEKEVLRIINTYLLEGAVCDGISYRGCPRACYWLWRDAWLRKVEEPVKKADCETSEKPAVSGQWSVVSSQ